MKNRGSLHDLVVKWFFGITGNYDEYKRQVVGRISTNAFLACFIFMIFATAIAGMWGMRSPYEALVGLMLATAVFSLGIIAPYVMIASHRAHLTDQEVGQPSIGQVRRKIGWQALGLGVYFGVVTYCLAAGNTVMADGSNFFDALRLPSNIWHAVFGGIFFGLWMGLIRLFRLKKQS
ncbi:DUF3278 domain-containing protein [Lactiplantibacillus sp. WILCCON 0030]|uniref:DUF3278 domain-containing protein n=1 Tax=Lactiplantibacillus brownii TaxID=3069269 RepID=A0ABU1AAZ3_9LACO|nr:DUF3278 domain-containing protein [Lactiplantibacillus brownii]MDQ7938041.1 DUF3278 domain-containing protein [Lactiplantibacillus brownii]